MKAASLASAALAFAASAFASPQPGAALPLVPYPQVVGGAEVSADAPLPPEGYFLRVDEKGAVTVRAADAAGRFYAEQTLRQLRDASPGGRLPAVSIRDWPRFPWRGVHLDESRHFFGKETVKRVLDAMARFKLNVFHWHLIDDSGWRLEIPGSPELTKAGATRRAKKGYGWLKDVADGDYGPFAYTADDVREILAYAAARHVRVVPEVELPGHSALVLRKCLPQFACDPKSPGGVFCLGNEDGMRFLEKVVDSVAALFPGEAIHIGGDEVDKSAWAKCPKCRALAAREGLASTDELQRWVTRRFCARLAAKGRRAVAWDEVVETDVLPENLVVMDWCGKGRGEKAAALGRPVVRCVHWSCYLDYAQCLPAEPVDYPVGVPPVPLSKVYEYDPLAGVPKAAQKNVVGGQCNNWTEWTCSREELEWKLWPRACAMAEALWTAPRARDRDYGAFAKRLAPCREALRRDGINAATIGAKDGLGLVPRPAKARLTLGSYTAPTNVVSEALVKFVADPALPAGHYRLSIHWERGITAAASDDAGRAAAMTAVRQLARPNRKGGLDFSCAEIEGARSSHAWEDVEAKTLDFEFRLLDPKGRVTVRRACETAKPRTRIKAEVAITARNASSRVWNAELGRGEWSALHWFDSLGGALATNVWHAARVVSRTNTLAVLVRPGGSGDWLEAGFCDYGWDTTEMSIDVTDGAAEIRGVRAAPASGGGRRASVAPEGRDVELGFATGRGRALVRLGFADAPDRWIFVAPEDERFWCTRRGPKGGEAWFERDCADSRLTFSSLVGFRIHSPAYVKAYRPGERAAAIDYAEAHPEEGASRHRLRMRFDASGDVWFDGKFMGVLTNRLASVSLYVPEVAPAGEYLRTVAPATDAGPRTLALRPEDCIGARRTDDGRAFLDVSTHKEHSDPGQETDHYLARDGFEGLRDSFVWPVPNRCWNRATVVAAIDPAATTGQVPVVTVRLSRNDFAGWGNAAATGRLDLATAPRRAVGQATVGGRVLDLFEYDVDLPVGDIQDRLYVKRGRAKFGDAPYLHAEVLGPLGRPGILWDKSQKPDWRTRSSAFVFGVTLAESPCELELLQSQPGLVFGDDEPRETSVRLKANRAGTFVLRVEIRDWDGARERLAEREVALAAGEERRETIDLAVGEGWHELAVSVAEKGAPGRPLVAHRASFADVGRDTRRAGKESPYAFWWSGAHHGGTADVDVMGPIFRKLGIRRISAIDGQHTEASMARYGLTASQIPFNINLASSAVSGKRPVAETVAEYEKWMRKYIEDFPSVERRAIVFHESSCGGWPNCLWNGPDKTWREGDFAKARKWLEVGVAICRMIREKFPDVKIQLGNSSTSYEILDVMFRLGFPKELFDKLGSETVARFVMPDVPCEGAGPASLAYLNLVAECYGYPQRADVCYEWVCQLSREITPTEAAEWGVRNTLLAFAAGATLAPIAGCTPDDAYYNSDYGSVSTLERHPYLYPTRAAVSKAVMTRELDGATFARRLDTGSQTVNALEFRRADGACVYAMWLPRGTARVALAGAKDGLRVLRAARIDMKPVTAANEVDLSVRPVFVTTDRPASAVRILSRATPPLVSPVRFQRANALASADEVEVVSRSSEPVLAHLLEGSRYRTNGVYSVSTGDGCVVLTRDRAATPGLWKTLSEFAYLKLKKPVVLAGEPATLSVEVDGNSSWAEIFFVVEDAEGKVFSPTGVWYEGDGRAHGRVNFDGWGTIQFPFSPKSRVRTSEVDARGGFWRCDRRGRKGDAVVYPVKIVGLAVSMPRQTARDGGFAPVKRNPDTLRFRNLGAFDGAFDGPRVATDEIVCAGDYGGHLQGVATDGSSLWWSFTTEVVRTDLSGRVLATTGEVPRHHGDLCVVAGKVYVAVNLGAFNRPGAARSEVRAYDAATLRPCGTWPLPEMDFGAGGMTAAEGRFFVVGGLPTTVEENFVYEYDADFRFVRRHALKTGFTLMGVQTAAFEGGRFLFGIYGEDGNPAGVLACPRDLSSFVRHVGPGSVGIVSLDGATWTARTEKAADGSRHRGRLVRSAGYPESCPADAPSFTGKGVVKIFYEGDGSSSWRDCGYQLAPNGYREMPNADAFVARSRAAETAAFPAAGIGGSRRWSTADVLRGVRRAAVRDEVFSLHVPGAPGTEAADAPLEETLRAVRAEARRLGVALDDEAVRDWTKMSPFDIVDTFYKPGHYKNGMKAMPPRDSQPWMKMKTEDFLPCIDRYGQFKWRDWPGKTKGDADLAAAKDEEARDLAAHPGPSGRTKFGGWAEGPQLAATGRFRTHRDARGRWWLVDPEGRLFWSFGPVRVSASSGMTPINGDTSTPRTGVPLPPRDALFEDLSLEKFWTTRDELLWPFYLARGETRVYDFSSANLFRKYGEGYYDVFADLCHRRLRSWGMNTIANSSDLRICLMDRTPYAERVECQSRFIEGSTGVWWKFRDPWDASFARSVTESLAAHGREAHDPWCIGFFIDNEISWGGPADLARWILQSPADQPAKAAFADWLLARHGSFAKLNAAWGSDYAGRGDFLAKVAAPPDEARAKGDLTAFSNAVIDRYFRVTRETVKKFDPALLYLGCRFGWGVRPEVEAAAVKYCDVVSYNLYYESLAAWRLPDGLDAPVMVGEFHFGATDRGPFGAGVCQARDQDDRAAKMKAYVESALGNPQIVGVHWHQFSDQPTAGRFDGEYQQVGLTDVCDRPYPIMRKALREVGDELYARRAR